MIIVHEVAAIIAASLAGAALVTGSYGWWVHRHPYRPCHWCKGAACLVCQHKGYVPRAGARLVRRWTDGGGRRGVNGRQS